MPDVQIEWSGTSVVGIQDGDVNFEREQRSQAIWRGFVEEERLILEDLIAKELFRLQNNVGGWLPLALTDGSQPGRIDVRISLFPEEMRRHERRYGESNLPRANDAELADGLTALLTIADHLDED